MQPSTTLPTASPGSAAPRRAAGTWSNAAKAATTFGAFVAAPSATPAAPRTQVRTPRQRTCTAPLGVLAHCLLYLKRMAMQTSSSSKHLLQLCCIRPTGGRSLGAMGALCRARAADTRTPYITVPMGQPGAGSGMMRMMQMSDRPVARLSRISR
jgi:hypothetical protein